MSLKHHNTLKQLIWQLSRIYPVYPESWLKAVELCQIFSEHHIPTTLGKFSKAGDEPESIVDEYINACTFLNSNQKNNSFYLSVKPPAFLHSFEHIKAICEVALAVNQGIHFDSHGHDIVGLSIKLIENLISYIGSGYVKQMTNPWTFGLTLPSRWKRSVADAAWAVKKGIRVRLVKGEFRAKSKYDEMEPRKGFLMLIDRLIGHVPEIAIATHDFDLATEAVERAAKGAAHIQLEILYGQPASRIISLSKVTHVPLRVYVAYGDTLLLYGLRHFLFNPAKILRPGFLNVFRSKEAKLYELLSHR